MRSFFTKFFAFIVLILVLYVLLVFVFPDFMDTYAFKDINQKIRYFKEISFTLSSPDGSVKIPF